jgi:hypothetical protein
MPLNFPSTPTNGQLYTDPNNVVWIFDGVKWNIQSGTVNKVYSGVKLKLDGDFALITTDAKLSWGIEEFDTDNYFSISTPQRVYFWATGYYRINLSVFTNTVGSLYNITLRKNNTTDLNSGILNSNQNANYDEIVEFNAGDYIEVVCSEDSSTGAITDDTVLEVTRVGLTLGTGIRSLDAFSGVRTTLITAFATSTTPTAVLWDTTTFNSNADVLGNNYWTSGDANKITIKTSGYYRIKSFIETATADNYDIILKKNNSTNLSTIELGPNSTASVDEIYNLLANDYIQIVVNDENSSGALTTNTYLEIVRIGI